MTQPAGVGGVGDAGGGTARRPMRSRGKSVLKPASDPFRIALAFLVVVSISRVHQHFPVLAALRPALVLAVLAAVFAVLNPNRVQFRNLSDSWPARIVAALGVMACFSVLFGISQGRSGKFFIENYSKVLLATFLIMVAIRTARDLKLFMWAYVIGGAIVTFFAIFIFEPVPTIDGLSRLAGMHTYDANDIGCVLAVGFPLALLMFQTSSTIGKVASGLTMVGIGVSIALSGSRGAFIGFLALGIVILFTLKEVSVVKRVAAVAVFFVSLALMAPEGYWDQMSTVLAPKEDYNWTDVNGRREIAKRGVGYMLSYPIFGIGVANFPMAEGTISTKARRRAYGTGLRWAAAHNSYLEAGAEMGIPGLVLWLILVFGGLIAMIRLRMRIPASWARGDPEHQFIYMAARYLPITIVGFAVTSFFVSFAYMDPIYLIAAFMTGLYSSVRAKAVPAAAVSPVRRGRSATRAARRRGPALS